MTYDRVGKVDLISIGLSEHGLDAVEKGHFDVVVDKGELDVEVNVEVIEMAGGKVQVVLRIAKKGVTDGDDPPK